MKTKNSISFSTIILGPSILNTILNAYASSSLSSSSAPASISENESDYIDRQFDVEEQTDEPLGMQQLPLFVWHKAVNKIEKYIVVVKRTKGVTCSCEAIDQQTIQLTFTATLETETMNRIATCLKLTASTMQICFPPQKSTVYITTSAPILPLGEVLTEDSNFVCISFPLKQKLTLVL